MSQEPKRQPQMVDCASTVSFTLRELLVYFLRLGNLCFGRTNALARPHAKRPGGRAPVGVEARLPRRSGLLPAFSRTLSCTVGDVLRLAACGSPRSNLGWYCLYLAFFPDGPCPGRSLRSLRQFAVDSRH